jgi:hypothetical protein
MTLTLIKEKRILKIRAGDDSLRTEEVMAFCPRCKALQTVWLQGNIMMPTRKFSQAGGRIYHNCGSSQPCILYS